MIAIFFYVEIYPFLPFKNVAQICPPVPHHRASCGKESASLCRSCRRCRFNPWVGKIPWKKKWQPTPVFLPGKSYGQGSLVGVHRVAKSQRQWSDWALMHALISPLPFMPLASQTSFFKAQGGMGITHSIWLSPGKVGTHLFCYCRDLASHHRAGRVLFWDKEARRRQVIMFLPGSQINKLLLKEIKAFPRVTRNSTVWRNVLYWEWSPCGLKLKCLWGQGNKVPSERNTELSVKKNGKRP